MKDFTQEQLEESRPATTPAEAVDFCLDRLYADKVKATTDMVVDGLTFEELFGALLWCKDVLDE